MKQFFYILFTIVLILLNRIAFSEHEFLATVDPSTGEYTKPDSIQGVKYVALYGFTTIDEVNNRMIFLGGLSESQFNLISLDASTGKVLFQPALLNYRNLLLLYYSSAASLLYGVMVQSGVYTLVTIDPVTANYVVAGTLNIDEVTEMIVDDLHHVMYLRGLHSGTPQLFTINMLNASVIKSAPSTAFNLQYDNSKGKLYGIDGNVFGNIDPATGTFTPVKSLPPDITGITQGNSTFDEKDQLYIFAATDNQARAFLYSIDATNGNTIYKAPVSLSNDFNKENLIQFRFDNSSHKLYALHWQPPLNNVPDSSCSLRGKIQLYPNPFENILIINKDPAECEVRFNLFNSLGRLLITGKIINDGQNQLKLSYLPDGVYHYEFYSNGIRLLTGRVVKGK